MLSGFYFSDSLRLESRFSCLLLCVWCFYDQMVEKCIWLIAFATTAITRLSLADWLYAVNYKVVVKA